MQNKSGEAISRNKQKLGYFVVSADHIIRATHSVKMLCARLLEKPPHERNELLQFMFCEVGYTIRRNERLKQHASRNIYNYVLNLAKAIPKACRIGAVVGSNAMQLGSR